MLLMILRPTFKFSFIIKTALIRHCKQYKNRKNNIWQKSRPCPFTIPLEEFLSICFKHEIIFSVIKDLLYNAIKYLTMQRKEEYHNLFLYLCFFWLPRLRLLFWYNIPESIKDNLSCVNELRNTSFGGHVAAVVQDATSLWIPSQTRQVSGKNTGPAII